MQWTLNAKSLSRKEHVSWITNKQIDKKGRTDTKGNVDANYILLVQEYKLVKNSEKTDKS